MKKKMKSLVLVLLAMALVLAACSSNNGSAAKKKATAEKVTINFLSWAGGAHKEIEAASVAKFNASHPNIEVKVEAISDGAQYDTKLNTLIAAGSPPDVAFVREPHVNNWGLKGTIIDLKPYLDKEPELLEDQLSYFTTEGKIYGLWAGAQIMMLYYNKKMFTDAGVSPPSADPLNPWTWDQMLDAAKKLTVDQAGKHPGDAGFDPNKTKAYGFLMHTWWGPLEPLLRSNGGGFATDDGTKPLIESEATLEVLQKVADLAIKEHVSPTLISQKVLTAPPVMMQNNQLAMFLSGQWETSGFGESKFDVGYAAIPMFKKPVNIVWSVGTSIFSGSKHPEEAWEFVKFLTSPDAAIEMYTGGVWIPTMKSWYEDDALLKKWTDNDVHSGDYVKVVKGTVLGGITEVPNALTLKNDDKLEALLAPVLDQIWQGQKTAKDALQGMNEQFQPHLQGVFK